MSVVDTLIDCTAPTVDRTFGNAEVVALLKKWLAIAEQGKLSFAAVAVTEPPRAAAMDFAGSIEMMNEVPAVLDMLKAKVEERLAEQRPPPQKPELDHSFFCHSITTQTVGYDFAFSLIAAEMDRIRFGAPAPLKVGFWAGGSGRYGINTAYRAQMFDNVTQPMLGLLGAVEDKAALEGHRGGLRLIDITQAARNGEAVPKFKPSRKAEMTVASWFLDGERPVVITLRECEHYPHRNSNIDAWLKFAKDLEAAGESVVLLRDTRMAGEALPGFSTCPAASTDINLRLALYEHAKLNFFGSNGPCALGWFGTAPFLQFIQLNDGSQYFPDRRWWWRDAAGIDGGEQMPWFSECQRIVWQGDDYKNICQAWEAQHGLSERLSRERSAQ